MISRLQWIFKRFPSFNYNEHLRIADKTSWVHQIRHIFDHYTSITWTPQYDILFGQLYEGYDENLSFHNQKHILDVFQMGACLLSRYPKLRNTLTELQEFTFYVSLVCHDLDHRGHSNGSIKRVTDEGCPDVYEDDVDDETSSMCSSSSYNEIHHIVTGVKILNENRIAYDETLFRKLIAYTDLARQKVVVGSIQEGNDDRSSMLLVLLMKLADIGHILRDWHTHLYFATAIHEEGVVKIKKNEIPSDTLLFNSIFVKPLIECLRDVNMPLYRYLIKRYHKNLTIWSNLEMRMGKVSIDLNRIS